MNTKQSTEARTVLVLGPTVRGDFFVADSNNNVFDGKRWRGFGHPQSFVEFRDAWIIASKLQKKIDRLA